MKESYSERMQRRMYPLWVELVLDTVVFGAILFGLYRMYHW